jgi:RND family efflux transporter MFP subunit
MKRVLMLVALVVAVASAACIGFFAGRQGGPAAEEEEKKHEQPKAEVQVAEARLATLGKAIVAYGVVRAAPEAVHVFSVPFEVRVRRFLVTPGQPVAGGVVLLEVDPSPATLLQVQQAKSNVESATKKLAQARHAAALQLQEARATRDADAKILAQTQRRVDLKLGTNQELLQAQEELELARLRLESLEKIGTTPEVLQAQQDLLLAELQEASLEKLGIGNAQVQSQVAGIVNNLIAQEGQIVPAGGPLIELAEEKRIEVRLNVEPGDAADLQAGQAITISSVNDKDARPVEGRVRLVTRRVNPASRLVEVFVSLPAETKLVLESYVRGRAIVNAKQVLAVPRAAVLPEEDKHVLYTIKDGKAVRHVVQTGLEDDTQVEILGGELKAGQQVIVEGNYELEDGMAVEIEKPGQEEHKAAEKEKAGEKEEALQKGAAREKDAQKAESPKAEKKEPAGAPEKAP